VAARTSGLAARHAASAHVERVLRELRVADAIGRFEDFLLVDEDEQMSAVAPARGADLVEAERRREIGFRQRGAGSGAEILWMVRLLETRDDRRVLGGLERRPGRVVGGELPRRAVLQESLDLVDRACAVARRLHEDDAIEHRGCRGAACEAHDGPVAVAERALAAVHRRAGDAHGEDLRRRVRERERDSLRRRLALCGEAMACSGSQIGIRDDRVARRKLDDGAQRVTGRAIGS
jgi:hypothetical protein